MQIAARQSLVLVEPISHKTLTSGDAQTCAAALKIQSNKLKARQNEKCPNYTIRYRFRLLTTLSNDCKISRQMERKERQGEHWFLNELQTL